MLFWRPGGDGVPLPVFLNKEFKMEIRPYTMDGVDLKNNPPKHILAWNGATQMKCDYCDFTRKSYVWFRIPYDGVVPEGWHITDCPFCHGLYNQAVLGTFQKIVFFGNCECSSEKYPGKVLLPNVLPHQGCWKCHGTGYLEISVDVKAEVVMNQIQNDIAVWTPDKIYRSFAKIVKNHLLKGDDIYIPVNNARQEALNGILISMLSSFREGREVVGIKIC